MVHKANAQQDKGAEFLLFLALVRTTYSRDPFDSPISVVLSKRKVKIRERTAVFKDEILLIRAGFVSS